jgi:DNA (cytosine-5)-methyltransferase 1
MSAQHTGPTTVSLFSGCGGLDLGFERAGFRTSEMVEISPYACETLRVNFPDAAVVGPPTALGDVSHYSPASTADVLVGGPPCQSFSIAAAQRFLKGDAKFKRTGFGDPKRGTLVREYVRILAELRPTVFLIENVPGLRELDKGSELGSLIDECRLMGYTVTEPTVVEAAEYGIPQFRRRLLVVGSSRGMFDFPSPTHGDGGDLFKLPFSTAAMALAKPIATLANHQPRVHRISSTDRYRRLRPGQREPLGRVDRLDPDRPSKTVIAGGQNGGGRSHLHPYVPRTLTVRECARLQTFPDDFVFSGTMRSVVRLLSRHASRTLWSWPGGATGWPSMTTRG